MKTYVKREKIIIKYKQYLKLEKSLSENTVQAYLTDLDKLFAYLTLENIDYTQVTLQDLEAFSAGLHDIGIHPRSQALLRRLPLKQARFLRPAPEASLHTLSHRPCL